jgi:zinc D-Ala-D-Ala carboxypeptidase
MSSRPGYRLGPAPLVLSGLLAVAGLVFSWGRSDAADPTRAGGASTPSAVARTSPSPSRSPTVPPLPSCTGPSTLASNADYPDWRRTLLDTRLELPRGYVPVDLVSTDAAGFVSEFQVRRVAIRELTALATAASDAGSSLSIVAAYRSFDQQNDLLRQRTLELGAELAAKRVAPPGHSEHQLGTAIDFTSRGLLDVNVAWGTSPAGVWMAGNSWRFGFVLSYPKGNAEVTCYPYEPWHFRYVGTRLAEKVHASGLTLREYLWQDLTGWTP